MPAWLCNIYMLGTGTTKKQVSQKTPLHVSQKQNSTILASQGKKNLRVFWDKVGKQSRVRHGVMLHSVAVTGSSAGKVQGRTPVLFAPDTSSLPPLPTNTSRAGKQGGRKAPWSASLPWAKISLNVPIFQPSNGKSIYMRYFCEADDTYHLMVPVTSGSVCRFQQHVCDEECVKCARTPGPFMACSSPQKDALLQWEYPSLNGHKNIQPNAGQSRLEHYVV